MNQSTICAAALSLSISRTSGDEPRVPDAELNLFAYFPHERG